MNTTIKISFAAALLCIACIHKTDAQLLSWIPVTGPYGLGSVTYGTTASGQSLFVAAGGDYLEHTFATSVNGYNSWQQDTDPSVANNPSAPLFQHYVTGLTYGENLFVGTADGTGGSSPNYIVFSPDGIVWAVTNSVPGATNLNAITYGALSSSHTLFVAVGSYEGSGVVATSGNLNISTWAYYMPPGADSLSAVTCGDGQFVAVGSDGTVVTSSDGVNWTATSDGDPNQDLLNGVAYGMTASGPLFVAVGAAGVIYTWDGITGTAWTPQTSGTSSELTSVAYGNGYFVATGIEGVILISSDGINWTAANSGTTDNLSAAGFGDGQFIVLGFDAILESPLEPIITGVVSYGANTGFTMTVIGPPGIYGIYVTHILGTPGTWLANVTFTSTVPSQTVTDPNAVNYSQGFYYLGPPGP